MWSAKRLTSFLACASALFGNALAAPAPAGAPVVTISPGVVVGKTTTVFSAPSSTATVVNFLGVPFAAVPTGTRRFASPVATSWAATVTATSLAPACRQQWSGSPAFVSNIKKVYNNPGGPPPPESEDCLYLNIYAPTSASTTNRKPVLFWIYGGNLQAGSNYVNYYNGSSFAGYQDVVVVSINYRTNIFGFSNSPEIPNGLRNVGLLDQRLALKWVQENIAAFGGDPNQVTIFGQSAGGVSVKQLLAIPPKPTLGFDAAIIESQGLGTGPPQNGDYNKTVAHFGCANAASPLACLRGVDGLAIENYISNNSLLFPPDPDNTTYNPDIRGTIFAGKLTKVPVLIGSNSQEVRVFLESGLINTNLSVPDALMGFFNNNTLVNQLIDAYDNASTQTTTEVLTAVLDDYIYTCPTARLSNYFAAAGLDTWRYYFNASFANLQFVPNSGAYHASEIPLAWGTYPVRNYLGPATPAEIALSRYMQTLWAKFPALQPAWPKLTTNFANNKIGELGGNNPTGETTISVLATDSKCALFEPIYFTQGP